MDTEKIAAEVAADAAAIITTLALDIFDSYVARVHPELSHAERHALTIGTFMGAVSVLGTAGQITAPDESMAKICATASRVAATTLIAEYGHDDQEDTDEDLKTIVAPRLPS